MKMHSKFLLTIILLLTASFSVLAQENDAPATEPTPETSNVSRTKFVIPSPQAANNPYRLKSGDNEWGFWGGFSPAATTVFGGLTDAEADDRKFFIAAFRYGRTLVANDSVALQYTLDAIPVAVASGAIVSRTTVGAVTSFNRETAYGAGLTPLGLQLDFANGSKVHPFIHVNGGFLVFNKSMPIEDAGSFAFVGEAGGGIRIFTSERRAVSIGVRFHHISNGDTSGSNRGLNQFVIYAGFSVFK